MQDVLSYETEKAGIQEHEVQGLLKIPKFHAAALAYLAGVISLGYAAWFCWPQVQQYRASLTEGRLMKYVHHVAQRCRLTADDGRRIPADWATVRRDFPELFEEEMTEPTKRSDVAKTMELQMGDFAAGEPDRLHRLRIISTRETEEFVSEWIERNWQTITGLLQNEKFHAGVMAYSQDALSYSGLAEMVFGDPEHVLFPDLGEPLSRIALNAFTKECKARGVEFPQYLQDKFPDLFRGYNPEAFGRGHIA